MSLPFVFSLLSGTVPSSDIDTNLNLVGFMGTTTCTVSGGTANAIQLTQKNNQPETANPLDQQLFSFYPTATPTGAITIALNGNSPLPLYYADGVTAAGAGAWQQTGGIVTIASNYGVNGGVGGGFTLFNQPNTYGGNTIGQIISSNVVAGAAVGLTNNTGTNITSINLTAGDWDVTAIAEFTGNAATTVTALQAAINTASGNVPRLGDGSYNSQGQPAAAIFGTTQDRTLPVGPYRVSLNAPEAIYLNVAATFAANTCSCYGSLRAVRATTR
jgi:hypothetical protein